MKAATNRTITPIPSLSGAFERSYLPAAIFPPQPNLPVSIPSSRSHRQLPLSEPAAHAQNDRIDRDEVGGGNGTSPGGVNAGSGTIGRPDTGRTGHEPGRADLPVSPAARQRCPTWFKAPRGDFQIMAARPEPDSKPKENQPENKKSKPKIKP